MQPLDLLLAALQSPERLAEADVARCFAALASPDDPAAGPRHLAIGALAASAYARPDLLTASDEALSALFAAGRADREAAGDRVAGTGRSAFGRLLEGLVATPLGPEIGRRLATGDGGAGELPRELRRRILAHAVRWWPGAVPPEAVLETIETLPMPSERARWLAGALEPLLDRRPDAVTTALVDRLETLLDTTPRCRHTLHRIASRDEIPDAIRRRARTACADRFLLRDRARRLLERPGFHVLFVQPLRIGQGDEILRLGPLLNGLLSSHPALRATVVTPRAYLYDHPRVTPVSLIDEEGARAALSAPWDGLVTLEEPAVPETWVAPWIVEELRHLTAAPRDLLYVACTVENHTACRRLALGGRDSPDLQGLGRLDVPDAYDTSRRLLAELGLGDLPMGSIGEPSHRHPTCFTTPPSADAERVWQTLRGDGRRPVALVWPHGGASETKGFLRDRPGELADELRRLVDDGVNGGVNGGWHVVIQPAGTAWSSRRDLLELVATLPEEIAAHVAVGPSPVDPVDPADPADAVDPAEPADAVGGPLPGLRERTDLSHADRVMRLVRSFALFADRVVTIEGWLGHLAAALGTPTRLVLMGGSYGLDWYPPEPVELAHGLAPPPAPAPGDPLTPDAPPPSPRRYPGLLLCTALETLGESGDRRGRPLLLRASESRNPSLRASAAAACRSHLDDPESVRRLVQLLDDPDHRVRAAAAGALLDLAEDGAPIRLPPREVLEAHRAVAVQDWERIRALGDRAMPALAAATRGDNATIVREARRVLALALQARLPAATRRGSAATER